MTAAARGNAKVSARRAVAAAGLAGAIIGLLLISNADAATTTSITSYRGLPANWHAESLDCSSYAASTFTPARVVGPATPPAGRGSLAVSESASADNRLAIDFLAQGLPLSAVHGFDSFVYVPATGGVTPMLVINATDGTTDYALWLDAGVAGNWVHADMATGSLTWSSWDDASGAVVQADQQSTLSAFVSNHADLTFEGFSIEPATPCAAGAFEVDEVHYAAGSTDSLVDFDLPDVTSLSHALTPTGSVPSGSAVTVSGQLINVTRGLEMIGNKVQLWSRPVGTSTYRMVWSGLTSSTGRVAVQLRPTVSTTYQWRFGGISPSVAPTSSAAFTLTTRTGVAISARPTTAGWKQIAIVRGRVTPAAAGITVHFLRLSSSGSVVVATTRTSAEGYYTFNAQMNLRGTATYVVQAQAYAGEPVRRSYTFVIKIV